MDTAKRIAAVRERLRELQTDEQLAKRSGPACDGCAYFKIVKTPLEHDRAMCAHMTTVDRAYDVIRGNFAETPKILAVDARKADGLCGPEAILYERSTGTAVMEDGPTLWRGGVNFMAFVGVLALGDLLSKML